MRNHRSADSHVSYLAVLCFFAGIFAGTIWANRMGGQLQEELGIFGQALLSEGAAGSQALPDGGQMAALLLKRGLLMGVLWLLGMSLLAVPGLCAAMGYLGFSLAFLLSCMTMEAGSGGLFLFLMSLLPQALFYLPVGFLLASWALMEENRVHGAGFAILLLLTAAGTGAELWLNPLFLKLAVGILR